MLHLDKMNEGEIITLHFALILGEGSIACYEGSYRKLASSFLIVEDNSELSDKGIYFPYSVPFEEFKKSAPCISRPKHIFVSDSREDALARLIAYEEEKQKMLNHQMKRIEKKIEFSKKIIENALKESQNHD